MHTGATRKKKRQIEEAVYMSKEKCITSQMHAIFTGSQCTEGILKHLDCDRNFFLQHTMILVI